MTEDPRIERFWRSYHRGRWEPDTKALLEKTLRPGDLFVDIGAWFGPVTLWALGCGARAIAIEPDPVALGYLRRNVPAEVEIWAGAVAVESGVAMLASRGELGESLSRLAEEGEVEVRTWTLEEILAGRVPKLVKVDIEGYEIELLPAIAPLLAELGSTLQVSLHGQLPDRDLFDGYGEVVMPDDPRGNLVAKPRRG